MKIIRPLVPVPYRDSFIFTPSALLTQKMNTLPAPAGECRDSDLTSVEGSSAPVQHLLEQMAKHCRCAGRDNLFVQTSSQEVWFSSSTM